MCGPDGQLLAGVKMWLAETFFSFYYEKIRFHELSVTLVPLAINLQFIFL